jgi:hypothetical protein
LFIQKSHTHVYLFRLLKHDTIITYQNTGSAKHMCHAEHEPYQNTQNADYPQVRHMTVAMGSNHCISYARWTSHYLYPQILQPKHQCMHGCGVSYIRTGEIMSSPFQYKIYRDLSSIKITEFSQRTDFSFSLTNTITAIHFFINFCLLRTLVADTVNTD